MALSQQTSELFARVFGRKPEGAGETAFLKGVESRKGAGTPEAFGAIQHAQQQGTSFGGFSQPEQPSEETMDLAGQGMDIIQKKIKQIDQAEKKLFREEQKLAVKQQMLQDPGFKELLGMQKNLGSQIQETSFEDIPSTPGVTDPVQRLQASIGQQQGLGSFLTNARNLAEQGEESVVNVLDRLGTQRQADYDNARQSLADLMSLRQEERSARGALINDAKTLAEMELIGQLSPEQRLTFGHNLAQDLLDRGVANTYEEALQSAFSSVDRYAGGFTPGSSGMRTDRHNNPTAFTTDIARQAGLVEGRDYTVGDPFPDNPNLRTATLIGDPVDQTIKVIDKIGFYTQGGAPRWTYIAQIPEHRNWKNLSRAQKREVISKMYQREGGNGSLLQGGAPSPTPTPTPTVVSVEPVGPPPRPTAAVPENVAGSAFDVQTGLPGVTGGIPNFRILN